MDHVTLAPNVLLFCLVSCCAIGWLLGWAGHALLRRPIVGEYRVFAPPLPSQGELAADLYRAYRCRAKPVSEGGTIPEELHGCSPVVREAWQAVAARVELLCEPPRQEQRIEGSRGTLVVTALALLCLGLAACSPTTTATIVRTSAAGVDTLDAVAASVVQVQGEAIRASAPYQDLRKSDPQGAYRLWQEQMRPYSTLGPAVTAARAAVMAAAKAVDAAGRKADKERGALIATAYGLGALWGVVDALMAAKVPVPAALTTTARYGCELVTGLLRGLDPKAPQPCPVQPSVIPDREIPHG